MTQKDVSYSKIVALIRKEINQVRTNPISLSGYLNSKKIRFDINDPLTFYPFKKTRQLSVRTKQGVKGITVEELDNFLIRQSTCQKLKWSYQLHLIAHKKALKIAKSQVHLDSKEIIQQIIQIGQQKNAMNNFFESKASTRSNEFHQEIMKIQAQNEAVQCTLDQVYYLTYFGVIDPKQIVSNLLIDDGYPRKEHRKALLNRKMNHIGIGIHQHPTQYFVVVIVLANHVKSVDMGRNLSEAPHCECQII